MKRLVQLTGLALGSLLTLLAVVWGAAAIWFDGRFWALPSWPPTVVYLLTCITLLLLVRPYSRALFSLTGVVGLVAWWWLLIPAENNRDWLPEVGRTAMVSVQGELLTVTNLRNFDYRSEDDYTVRWDERRYDLAQLKGLDIFLCYWGPTAIAHTILSWEFADGEHLAVSIETRKEKGEFYSALRGFFRQYEVYYVVADERDVVRLRTNFRNEELYLYRTNLSVKEAKRLLLDYAEEVNRLARQARWYNAMTHNCTTAIRYHAQHVLAVQPWDWRMLLNGSVDQMLFERERVASRLPFNELREASKISAKAREAEGRTFSQKIRDGLPTLRAAKAP